jgi:hypothetical protein
MDGQEKILLKQKDLQSNVEETKRTVQENEKVNKKIDSNIDEVKELSVDISKKID